MDFTKTIVYQYHLVISPEIPEDSRGVRKDIIKHYQDQITEKIG